ncbi:MAG TPA: cupin domain-containing protein [Rubrobacter sp.]|nr:cupin domain-containing protein [Rubrobacter sp.]
MVEAGDVLENPVSGQHLIIRITAQDTGGELLEVESVYTKPTPSRPPVHYHPLQEERFKVLSGGLNVLVDGRERTLEEGEVLIVAPGVPHQMWAEEAGARVNWQTRPALKTEAFFETVWGLVKDGKVNDKGVPNPLRAALIAREYEEEFRLASPPWAIQRLLFGSLALVGRLLGYQAEYPYPHRGAPQASPASEEERPPATSRMAGVVAALLLAILCVLFLLRRRGRSSG